MAKREYLIGSAANMKELIAYVKPESLNSAKNRLRVWAADTVRHDGKSAYDSLIALVLETGDGKREARIEKICNERNCIIAYCKYNDAARFAKERLTEVTE